MRVVLVGSGQVSYFLAKRFLSKGHMVTIVNRNRKDCHHLAEALEKVVVVCGDGSDVKALDDAGASRADLFVALTPSDADNLISSQMAKIRFGIPKVVTLVNDPENESIFRQLGISAAFSTTTIIGMLIEEKLAVEDITNLIPIEEGRVQITEIVLDSLSPVCGKQIKDISFPEDAVIACIIRGGSVIIPRGHTQFEVKDKIVIISLPETLGNSIRALKGSME